MLNESRPTKNKLQNHQKSKYQFYGRLLYQITNHISSWLRTF